MRPGVVDVDGLIEEMGWQAKSSGEERVMDCPLCGKPEKFSINARSGLWRCFVCVEKGNWCQLHQHLKGLGLVSAPSNGHAGGQPTSNPLRIQSVGEVLQPAKKRRIPMDRVEAAHQALLRDDEALDYCMKTRCWSREAIQEAKLGLRVDGRGKWIAYPWLSEGECFG